MHEARGAGDHKPFIIAMIVLMVLLVAAAGVAWWFLEQVQGRIEDQRAAEAELRGAADAASALLRAQFDPPEDGSFIVRLTRRGDGPTEARLGTNDVGGFDDPETLTRIEERARAAFAAASPGDPGRRARVAATPAVPAHDVVRAVDALIAAGFTDVAFAGTPPPGAVPPTTTGAPK